MKRIARPPSLFDADFFKHRPGGKDHDQKTHGRSRGGSKPALPKPPTVNGPEDFQRAKEYMQSIGSRLEITKDLDSPELTREVRMVVDASYEFRERTGYAPPPVVIATTQQIEQKFGARAAMIAQGLYDPKSGQVYSSKLDSATLLSGYTVDTGKHPPGVTVLWHEFGHGVHFAAGNKTGYDLPVPTEFHQTLRSQGMSEYGLTMRAEFVAEYVSGRMQGVDFGPDVTRLYNEFGGPALGF